MLPSIVALQRYVVAALVAAKGLPQLHVKGHVGICPDEIGQHAAIVAADAS